MTPLTTSIDLYRDYFAALLASGQVYDKAGVAQASQLALAAVRADDKAVEGLRKAWHEETRKDE